MSRSPLTLILTSGLGALVMLLAAHEALAAANPEMKCRIGRRKAAAGYASCQQKAVAVGYSDVDFDLKFEPAIAKCRAKYAKAWIRLEAQASGSGSTCDTPRFVDNGDGTVTDNLTALQWERKTDDLTVHAQDSTYSWTTAPLGTVANGSVFQTFLDTLNSGCFAGQCDWRLPTPAELQTIFLVATYPCPTDPCVDTALFGPSLGGSHWTATTEEGVGSADGAWVVNFGDGSVYFAPKTNANFVRAVRGGL